MSVKADPAGVGDAPLRGKRVLVLFGGSHLFGQERANLEVMRTLRDAGASVYFIINSRFGREHVQPALEQRGFEWSSAPFGYHWSRHMLGRDFGNFLLNLYGVVVTSWRLNRAIKRWKPTHLYTMSWSYFVFALPALRMSGLPLVYRAGDVLPEHTAFHRWITRQLRRRVTRLVCNCQFVATRFARLGFTPAVIYNHPPERPGIARETKAAQPARAGAAVRLAYVGQVAEHKGVALLIDSVIALVREGLDLELDVVGDSVWGDPLRKQLQELVDREGLGDRIHFLGEAEDVPAILRGADLHVCPSIWEDPSPNVILEAKREGIPSVAFAVGGIPELIRHEVDGYLVRTLDMASLGEGIKFFARDNERRKAAGLAARESYERNFSFARFREEWIELIS